MSDHADLILHNGRIFCGLGDGFCDAVAVHAGRVVAAGARSSVDALARRDSRIIDLRGRSAMAGFNDAHQHLLSLGRAMMQINLKPAAVTTLDQLLETIRRHAATTPEGEWIVGGRYDHYRLDVKRHPLREELDRAAPRHPVYIKRTCAHMGVANSMALAIAGVDRRTPDPPGGHIERRDDRLTGLLQERAQELVLGVVPPAPPGALVAALEAAAEHMLSLGVTSVMDAAVGAVQGFDDYLAYQQAHTAGRLPVRCYLGLFGGPSGILERCIAEGVRTGAGDERLKVGPAKIFTDGSAGGSTAAMSAPYLGDDSNRGIFVYEDAELLELMRHYHAHGYQMATHAIGDAAIEQTLRGYERVLGESTPGDYRHRIEHCGFVTPDQVDTMCRLGVYPAPQPVFLRDFGDLYVELLGETRAAGSHPMKTWMHRGLYPAASTDAPVCGTSVMANLHAMLTRQTADGHVLGTGERLTPAESVSAVTENGAYLSFSEAAKGRLAAGQLADVTVTDRNIFAAAPHELLDTQIDLTLLGGEIVDDRLGEHTVSG